MRLRDLFKNKNSNSSIIQEKNDTIEQLNERIAQLESLLAGKDRDILKLNKDIKDAKDSSGYKTRKTLENIQVGINNQSINTFSYNCNNIQIRNDKVFIDGVEQKDITNCKNKNIFIKLTSPCDVDCINVENLRIDGDVQNVDITNGNITCNDIKGDIDQTNGNIYRSW